MIQAHEARKLSYEAVNLNAESITVVIEKAAKEGHNSISLRDGFWTNPTSTMWVKAKRFLENHGYTVEFVEARMDNHTIVSWSK